MPLSETASQIIRKAFDQYELRNLQGSLSILQDLRVQYSRSFHQAEPYEIANAVIPDAIAWCPWVQLAIRKIEKELGAAIVATDGVCPSLSMALQYSEKGIADSLNLKLNEMNNKYKKKTQNVSGNSNLDQENIEIVSFFLTHKEASATLIYQAIAEMEDGSMETIGTYWTHADAQKCCVETAPEMFPEEWQIVECVVEGDRPDQGETIDLEVLASTVTKAQATILDLIKARGPQSVGELKKEVLEQTAGVDLENASFITSAAIGDLVLRKRLKEDGEDSSGEKIYEETELTNWRFISGVWFADDEGEPCEISEETYNRVLASGDI